MEYQVNFGSKNKIKEDNHIQSVVKAIDRGQISRDSYRDLTATDYHLIREYSISNKRIEITKHMNQVIKFSLVNVKENNNFDNLENLEFEEPHITNTDIIREVSNIIGIGVNRSAKDILCYIIPHLQKKQVLDSSNPIIHLRISGDGRNVGRKIKHVMVTFMILNHESKHHHADYHYTVALYPGAEKYNTLKFMLSSFLKELHSFKDNGLELNGILWKFELYFSSDWKFLAICLGLNGANSKYFCPWCSCSKDQIGDLSKDWNIEKNIDEISKNYININGHINPPLFSMIPIGHLVFDELHVLLRITDRLWELVIAEIKERESKNWEYTSLVGDDKEIVLKFFNLELLFRPSRANLIRKLWDEFYNLYCDIKDKMTDPIQLKKKAYNWLSLFLTPPQGKFGDSNFVQGLYMPNQITPYIHAVVYHGWELLKINQQWGLKAFSCSAVEKKNHDQVSTFFRKTLKNGGNPLKKKSAIEEIIEYENRTLYYNYNSFSKNNKIKKLHVK
ncbi:hypothetical protein Glove_438g53 [Diversispora epigaea]|uniref:Transposase domain-containing protein n=1 Tax=Diversispora epigaea TaxID=1348612 RepID=A0A397H031_9GLOM|nr:hypothetical protein Glove_438g53 [Diversispora epigaea]